MRHMIHYEQSLNPAQYAAATAPDGSVLVIAGAGSGKTRTIVYRLAWLAEQNIAPASMLLLTFTRKSAQEMLHRASLLLGAGLMGVNGGTFHSFAYGVLRRHRPLWLEDRNFSLMDNTDMTAAIKQCKDALKLGKGDRSFPKSQNILSIFSKSRNKEMSIENVLRRESMHLLPHCDALCALDKAYTEFRRSKGLLDYDDLLFELERLLQENTPSLQGLRQHISHIMVDEYQDTNLVQARIIRLLGAVEYGGKGNVMAVGDDAQSIYAFRGANVRNILDFPQNFANTKIIRLEENYRSTQPILDVSNALLENAHESYRKHLFTRREGGAKVRRIIPVSNKSQAQLVVARIRHLLTEYLPHEIAVLFRAGFHSYDVELALNKVGISFRKYGGLRFSEAAHIKDVLAYARLLINPLDISAFDRVANLHRGIGPKTMQKLYDVASLGDSVCTEKIFAKYPEFLQDIRFLDEQRNCPNTPQQYMQNIIIQYQKHLERVYPDDFPRRRQGLEEIVQMASPYTDLDLLIADLVLETPEKEEASEQHICLSTVHSAKGLEWNAVLIIDLVEDRFPSRHAALDAESFEEERRLMYVACTRARQHLDLYAPATVSLKGYGGNMSMSPSPFLRELPATVCEDLVEAYEGGKLITRTQCTAHTIQDVDYDAEQGEHIITDCGISSGMWKQVPQRLVPESRQSEMSTQEANSSFIEANTVSAATDTSAQNKDISFSYCHHKIFGRGKIIKILPPDKCQVNFPGFGLKVILRDFLTLTES